MKALKYLSCVLILLCVQWSFSNVSGKDMPRKTSRSLTATGLTKDSNTVVFDNMIPALPVASQPPSDTSWRSDYYVGFSKARAVLKLVEPIDSCGLDTFSERVAIRLIWVTAQNQKDSMDTVLTVNYDRNNPYTAQDFYERSNVHYLYVKILSVSNANVKHLVKLEAELDQQRFRNLANGTVGSNPPGLTLLDSTTQKGEYVILINPTSDIFNWAEEYDLEWTFVDAYASDMTLAPTNQVLFDTRFNTTRVSIKQLEYRISNVFEKGYLIFRVRAVGRGIPQTTQRIEGPWNWTPSAQRILVSTVSPSLFFTIQGSKQHEDSLNWQYQCSYAEEGKRKEVVSYYDGSLRNRQLVTRSTTSDFALVQDKIYDHQGRPAIEVLPAPTTPNVFKFFRNFTLDHNGNSYGKEDFDFDGTSCTSPVDSMKTTSGASKYYSAQNQWIGADPNYQNFVPVAKGYPFIQTEYTPDNTGRVSRVSMPGINHKLESGHESVNYYGTPFQEELDMLFGSEVGFAAHYMKEMAKDPNGQLSIAYKNPAGKLIATALAGQGVTGMATLDSNKVGGVLTVNLLDSTVTSYEKDAIVTRRTFLVTHNTQYKFRYAVNGKAYDPDCVPEGFCLDCVYDLEVSLMDGCRRQQFIGDKATPTTTKLISRKIGGNTPDTICQNNNNYSFATDTLPQRVGGNDYISLNLQPGEYTITKILRVNREAKEYYTEQYLKSQNCKTLEDFVEEAWASMDTTGCEINCTSCNERLGTRSNYLTTFINKLITAQFTPTKKDTQDILQQYDFSKKECDRLCDTIYDMCDGLYMMMRADVSPGGLYGKVNLENPAVRFDTSVFYKNATALDSTFDDLAIFKNTKIMLDVDGDGDIDTVPYSQLSTAQFVANWQDTFADHLVQLHPEYCYYDWCRRNTASNEFDYAMLSIEDYDSALALGYLNPLDSGTNYSWNIKDPFFVWPGEGYYYVNEIDLALRNYQTVTFTAWPSTTPQTHTFNAWDIPIMSMYCNKFNSWDTASFVDCIYSHRDSIAVCDKSVKNFYWTQFKSIYQATKRKKYEELQTAYLSSGWCAAKLARRHPTIHRYHESPPAFTGNVNDKISEGSVDLAAACDEQCRAYAEGWLIKLQGCDYFNPRSEGQILVLKNALINVCKNGCDADNPFGSSTVDPAKRGTPGVIDSTFHDVLVRLGIFRAGICDEILIKMPKPYGHDFMAYDNYKADTCACDSNKYNWPLGPAGMVRDTVTAPNESGYCSDCVKSVQAKGLILPAQNAVQYRCKSCVTCDRFALVYEEFESVYDSIPLDTFLYRELFTNFLNNKLSFNLSYKDYLSFAKKCVGDSAMSNDSVLRLYRDAFQLTNYTPPGYYDWREAEQIYGNNIAFVPAAKPVENLLYKPVINPAAEALLELMGKESADMMSYPSRYGAMLAKEPHVLLALAAKPVGKTSVAKTLSSTPQPGYLKLDHCGCDKIMKHKYDYERLSPPSTQTFAQYVNGIESTSFSSTAELDEIYDRCETYFLSGGGDNRIQEGEVGPWLPGAVWTQMSVQMFWYADESNPLYIPQKLTCVTVPPPGNGGDPPKPGEFMNCDKLNAEMEALYQTWIANFNPTTKPFLEDLYDQTSVLDKFIQAIEAKRVSNTIASSPFTKYNLHVRASGCRVILPCSLFMASLSDYINTHTFDAGRSIKDQLFEPAHITALLNALNTQYNKPSYYAFFTVSELKAHMNRCLQDFCPSFLLTVEQYINDYSWLFPSGASKKLVLQTDTIVRDSLINRANALANRMPYLLFFDTAVYRASVESCMPSFCEKFMEVTGDFINNTTYGYWGMTGDIPFMTQLTESGQEYRRDYYYYTLNTFSNGYPYYVFFDDTADVGDFLRTCAPAFPCDSVNVIFNRFLETNEESFAQDYRTFKQQLTSPGKQWLLGILTAMVNQSSHLFPYQTTLTRLGVMGQVNKCVDRACCYAYKNFSWANSLAQSFLDVYPPQPKNNKGKPKTKLLTSHRWRLNSARAGIYPYASLYNYQFRDSLTYYVTHQSRLKLNAEIRGPSRLNEDTFRISWVVQVDDSMRFNYLWLKSMSLITLLDNSSCTNGTIILNYWAEYYLGGDENNVMQCPLTVTMSAFPFVQGMECDLNTVIHLLCNKPFNPPPPEQPNPCKEQLLATARYNAINNYRVYKDSLAKAFEQAYVKKCLEAYRSETMTMEFADRQYHYTLYYYDQAGNLVKTVPPNGVKPITNLATLTAIHARRVSEFIGTPTGSTTYPVHTYLTEYLYNSLNQLTWQKTPDAGESNFYYDKLGRMVLSVNARQAVTTKYSYTFYDGLGRITEVGELTKATFNLSTLTSETAFRAEVAAGVRNQITRTLYDADPLEDPTAFKQDNLRNRVSKTSYHENNAGEADYAMYYSYDPNGNVKKLIRQITSLAIIDQKYKIVDYEFDLISGKVNAVYYQRGEADQFIHKYTYDAENRLVNSLSAPMDPLADADYKARGLDARYQYYHHGPLSRTEIGDLRVQGMDYAYTIQGWLKGVNGGSLYSNRDMGHDGDLTPTVNVNRAVATDAYGYVLQYFEGDYTAVKDLPQDQRFYAKTASSGLLSSSASLYNGNISMMITAVSKFMENGASPLGTAYQYDQLNRIKNAWYYDNLYMPSNEWQAGGVKTEWHNRFTYDPNGNIMSQVRRGNLRDQQDASMDSLEYKYYPGTNRLKYVTDGVHAGAFLDDIDNQDTVNYVYDEIGNLIKDKAEEIDTIFWNVYGKITRIKRISTSKKPDLEFAYSPDGHRVMKVVIPKAAGSYKSHTYYVRDAQGNILATYERNYQKMIDYDSLKYAAVNDSLIKYASMGGFAGFIATVHSGPLPNTGLQNALTSAVLGNPWQFLANCPVNTLLQDRSDLYQAVLLNYDKQNLLQSLLDNGVVSPEDLFRELCNCIGYEKLWEYIFSAPKNRETFFKLLQEYDDAIGYGLVSGTMNNLGGPTDVGSALEWLNEYPNYDDGGGRKQAVINLMNAFMKALDVTGWKSDCDGTGALFRDIYDNLGSRSELLKLLSGLPDMSMMGSMKSFCTCWSNYDQTGIPLLEWFVKAEGYDGFIRREFLIRALFILDPASAYDIMNHIGYPTTDVEDAVDFLLNSYGGSDADLADAFETYKYTPCSEEFLRLMETLYMYFPNGYSSILNSYPEPMLPTAYEQIKHDVGCAQPSFECVENLVGRPEIITILNNDRQNVWDMISSLSGYSANYYVLWIRDYHLYDFYFNAVTYHKSTVDAYQQANNMYGGEGNGMKAYFDRIRLHFGQAFYESLLQKFYDGSNVYTDSLALNEWHIYGSSRLGTYAANKNVAAVKFKATSYTNGNFAGVQAISTWTADLNTARYQLQRGNRRYELSNHLGNVLSVITDKKLPKCMKFVYEQRFNGGSTGGWTNSYRSTLVVNGTEQLNVNGLPDISQVLSPAIPFVVGKQYRLSLDLINLTPGNYLIVYTMYPYGPYTITWIGANGHYDIDFTAVNSSMQLYFNFQNNNSSAPITFSLDNITIEEKQPTSGATFKGYTADIIQANDYSPFGAPLPGRQYNVAKPKTYLVNDSFTTTAPGWSTAGASQTVVGGRLRVNPSGTAGRTLKAVSTVAGKYYTYTVTVDVGTASGVRLYTKKALSGLVSDELVTTTVTQSGTYKVRFRAETATTYIFAEVSPYVASTFFYIDNVQVEEEKEVDEYRFGFNGYERDDEVVGNGNTYDYGERIYNSRLGRFLSIDPIFKKYPFYSPYQYNSNTPIWIVDVLGMGDPLTVMQIRGNRASNLQGMVRNGGTRPHQGYDLAAAPGTSALAVKNAVVHNVGYSASYGNYVTLRITNDDGTYSYAYYAHLSCIGVVAEQEVREGQEIGTTGQTGNAQGQALSEAHLHFEYRSEPSPGLGLGGRLDPNDVLDTKFYSQNTAANQTNTGVIKVETDGSRTAMNLDGSTIVMPPIQQVQLIPMKQISLPQPNLSIDLPAPVTPPAQD